MTIFLDVAKAIIVEEIDIIINNSRNMDDSYGNLGLTTLGFGRNTALSKAKRSFLDELKVTIAQLKESKNDKKALEELSSLISDCKEKAKKESSKKDYDEGSLGPALMQLMQEIQEIYQKLESKALLDIAHDKQPLHIFSFFAALYSAKKIVELNRKGFFKSVWSNPQVSSVNELAQAKEKMLWKRVDACKKELDTLDKQHEAYTDNVKKCVARAICDLLQKNEQFCSEKQSLFFKPGLGFLHEVLTQALVAIDDKTITDSYELGGHFSY